MKASEPAASDATAPRQAGRGRHHLASAQCARHGRAVGEHERHEAQARSQRAAKGADRHEDEQQATDHEVEEHVPASERPAAG